jgi:SWI/SNF-related matrix-associated actin-dependent regulator of chromatin subfamily A-like protein 1
MSRLSYNAGRFELDSIGDNRELLARVVKTGATYNSELGKFIIRSPQLAATFIDLADESAMRVFDRVLLKKYELKSTYAAETLGLFAEQVNGVYFILGQNRTYLADEPGFGKSAQVIVAGAIAMRETKLQMLIICPPQLTKTWAHEIDKHWPYETKPTIETIRPLVNRFYKNSFDYEKDILIIPDSLLEREYIVKNIYKRQFALIGVDEAHRFKNETALRSVMLFGGFKTQNKSSPGFVYNSRHTVMLSGTPMLNRPIELWPVLYCMAPETINFMGKHDYASRYCGAFINSFNQWVYKGSSNELELRDKIFNKYMIRRKLDEADLPEKIRRVVYVSRDLRTSHIKGFEKNAVESLSMAKVMELSDSPYLSTYRKDIGLLKVEFISEYARLRLDAGENVLLFLHHKEVVAQVAENLKDFLPIVINGDTKKEVLLNVEKNYELKGGLLIGNLDTLGVGFTLTKANRVIFGEFSWTQKVNEQCENRAARRGQRRQVLCEYLVFEKSLDEKIYEIMFNKESKIRKVIE